MLVIKDESSEKNMIEEIREAKSFDPFMISDKHIKEFFKHKKATLVLSSDSVGLGKSKYIENEINNM